MTDLADLSLVEAADAVRNGEATSMELLDACWRNMEAANPQAERDDLAGPRGCRDGRARGGSGGAREVVARPAARRADDAQGHVLPGRQAQHLRLGACAGTVGPTITATVIEKLSAAGAYTFGGLNMAEFAQNPTGHNRAFGDCHNPWNPPYITGGSSSGSGASVAARFNYMALGSDTGGSIRLPAAACGVTGIKPTQTRVSRYGVMPLSFSADNVGPLTRTARDCARVMTLIAGRDPRDPTSSHEPVPDYEAALDGDIRGLRIGLPINLVPRRRRSAGARGDGTRGGGAGGARRDGAADRAAADGRGHRLWQHRLARRGGDDPRAMDARAGRRLRHPYQRPDVSAATPFRRPITSRRSAGAARS